MNVDRRVLGPVVITGATSGIGQATARELASRGFIVWGTGRTAERCIAMEAELNGIGAGFGSDTERTKHRYFAGDLSSLAGVRSLAGELHGAASAFADGKIGCLVNNAGTYSSWYQATEDGFELQLAVNHLAPFLLTHELMDALRASGAGRMVIVSSSSHYGARFPFDDPNLLLHYGELRSYGRSKLANVLFGYELSRRLGAGSPVTAHVADPGLARTEMGYKGASSIARAAWTFQRWRASPPARAANGIAFLVAGDDAGERPGLYWRDAKPLRSSAESYDRDAAERLWALSERMCGIDSRSSGLGPY